METSNQVHDPVATPLGQRLRRARVGALPVFVWILASFAAVRLWLSGPQSATFVGLAHALEVRVSSPVDGKLADLLVGLFEVVTPGQPLAVLDDSGLEARITTAQAELERLAAELESEHARIEAEEGSARRAAQARHGVALSTASLEIPAELRAFHADEAGLELRLLETRLAITTSELEADRLELRIERARALADFSSAAEVDDLELRRAVELARVEQLGSIERGLSTELEQARARRGAVRESYAAPPGELFQEPEWDERLAGWRAAVVVQEKLLDELQLLREAHVLRSPIAGRVAALEASGGQYLLAGDPILVLLDSRTGEVAMWIPEWTATPPRIGDRFRVARATDPRGELSAECVVQAISPRYELMPERLWRDVRVPEYGRACRISPAQALGLTPGERVRIDPLEEQRHGPL